MSARQFESSLLFAHLEAQAPPLVSVKAFHEDLVRHLELPINLKVIRKAGRKLNGAAPRRGVLYNVPSGRVVCGDNEPAVWIYTRLMRGWSAGTSLEKLLMDKLMPVADSRADGDGSFRLETVRRPWAGLLDHKHIFDAGRNFEPDLLRISEEDLAAMCMRLLNPMNHFLYPSAFQHLAEHDGNPQRVAAWLAYQRYGPLFEEFCKFAKCDLNFALSGEALSLTEELPTSSSVRARGEDSHVDGDSESVKRLPDDARLVDGYVSAVTGNDDSNRENAQQISPKRMNAPFYLHLHWRENAASKPYFVGLFDLDLRRLLDEGVIYAETDGKLRIKIKHCASDGGFYLRRTASGPSVRLDRLKITSKA
jgi:hypothetical protein